MRITLQAQRHDDQPFEVIKSGSVIEINGEAFDFSSMPEGSSLPASAIRSSWFVGDIDMQGGELRLGLVLPVPANYSPEQAFPLPLVDVPDGPVALPQPLAVTEAMSTPGSADVQAGEPQA